ncbi:MFS transporter [Pseudonocardia sp. CA-107938]|uniref:MFS transporter n=1 Tax=Pseudonocardia sp. CA-107938 TaxID=3240021 RepID=UPI003D90C457
MNRRDFTLLWLGQAVSQLGSRTYGVAYMLWVLHVSTPVVLGLAATVTLAGFAAGQLPAGWLADAFDRRRVLVVTDLVAAAAAGSFLVMAALDRFSVAGLLVAATVLGVCWAVRQPTELAAVPAVTGPDRVQPAVAIMQARAYAAGLAGPLLAGVLFAVAPWLPFLLDTASYLVAAVATAAIRTPLSGAVRAAGRLADSVAEVRAGLAVFWRQPFVRASALLSGAGALVVGGVGICVLVRLTADGAPPAVTGLVLGIGSAAGLGGALATPLLLRRCGEGALLVAAPLVTAAAVAALAAGSGPVALTIAYAAVFLLQPAWDAVVTGRQLLLVDDAVRGRVQAAAGLVMAVPMAATPALAGAATQLAGPTATLAAGAVVMAAVAAGAAVLARPRAVPQPAATSQTAG